MSTINQGLVGGFSGKTGPVIGSSWKGRPIMRARPMFKKNRKFSQNQLDQQEKFKLMSAFINNLAELLMVSFHGMGNEQTGLNAALSYNLREAIDGLGSPFAIDYSKVRLSQGTIALATRLVVTAPGANIVECTWEYDPNVAKTAASDKIAIVLFSETMGQFILVKDAAARSAMELSVNAGIFTGETVHCWLLFLSEDETRSSNSFYAGTVNIEA